MCLFLKEAKNMPVKFSSHAEGNIFLLPGFDKSQGLQLKNWSFKNFGDN